MIKVLLQVGQKLHTCMSRVQAIWVSHAAQLSLVGRCVMCISKPNMERCSQMVFYAAHSKTSHDVIKQNRIAWHNQVNLFFIQTKINRIL